MSGLDGVLRIFEFDSYIFFFIKMIWNAVVLGRSLIGFEDTVFLLIPLAIRFVAIFYKYTTQRLDNISEEVIFTVVIILGVIANVFIIWHFKLYSLMAGSSTLGMWLYLSVFNLIVMWAIVLVELLGLV